MTCPYTYPPQPCVGCAPGDCERARRDPPITPVLGVCILLCLAVALMLLLSCSSAQPVPPAAARIPEGDYSLRAYVDRSEGACDWLKRGLMAGVRVDEAGQISSPLPGASCTTTYGDWITFTCTGIGAKLTARGVLEPSGADGTGEIRGSVGGCTFVAFTFQLVRR